MIAGYTLVVKAPIELYNALPMPLTVALSSTDPDRSSLPERMLVQPLQSLLLHQMGAFHHLDKVALEPSGYCLSSAMGLPHGPSPRNGCASISSTIPALAHICSSQSVRALMQQSHLAQAMSFEMHALCCIQCCSQHVVDRLTSSSICGAMMACCMSAP